MSALSEVSILIGQRAADLEKAREVFTAEARSFVTGVLAGIRRVRSEPWTSGRVRLELPREIDTETKSAGYLTSQYALARANLRYKKGTLFTVVAGIPFGIEFDEAAEAFAWQITLVPAARYQRIDDILWNHWRTSSGQSTLPGSAHLPKSNTVRFVSRPVGTDLTAELAFTDVKSVLEFSLTTDALLAEAVGLDLTPEDETP